MTKKSNIKRIGAAGCALALCASCVGVLSEQAMAWGEVHINYNICESGKDPVKIFSKTTKANNTYDYWETKVRGIYSSGYDYAGILDSWNGGLENDGTALKNLLKEGNAVTGWVKEGTSESYVFGRTLSNADRNSDLDLCAVVSDLKHGVKAGTTDLAEDEELNFYDKEEGLEDRHKKGSVKFEREIHLKANRADVSTIDVKFTLNGSEYYRVKSYSINGGEFKDFTDSDIEGIIVENVTTDTTIDVEFERLTFDLKVIDTSANTEVEFPENENEGTEGTTAVVLAGDDQRVKISSIAGYKITGVTMQKGDETPVSQEIDNPEMFETTVEGMLSDYTVTVTTAIKEYTMYGSFSDGHGTVTPVANPVALGGTAEYEFSVNKGFKLVDITANGESVDVENYDDENGLIEIVVSDDLEAEGEFEKIRLDFVTKAIKYEVDEEDKDQKIDVSEAPEEGKEDEPREVTIRINGDLDLLESVEFDGKLLERGEDAEAGKDYYATEGSTVLHFDYAFLLEAGNGEHEVKANFSNGTEAKTTLTIAGVPVAPDTGFFSSEKANAAASIAIVAGITAALGAVLALVKRLGKKEA